jgi:hypothetical protein
MISTRRFLIALLLLIGLPALAFEALSGGIDQPAISRGKLPVEQPAPVRPVDQIMDKPSSVGVQEVSRPDGGRDAIYYSVTPPEEKQARQQAEIHKQERSLDIPNSAIIIRR